jgi:hypothetical protein
MNFIETLKSIGGVKPCSKCQLLVFTPETPKEARDRMRKKSAEDCPDCHGTGQILDFAPLLASTKHLSQWMSVLRLTMPPIPGHGENICVVGPQRASNLVYEIARQLGGTAVVVEPIHDTVERTGSMPSVPAIYVEGNSWVFTDITGYRLSMPIPPDATVLFVTDRYDWEEMRNLIGLMDGLDKVLPYVLTLIGVQEDVEFVCQTSHGPNESTFKVISLHQEKP